jgi:uracil-DNA glycosylase
VVNPSDELELIRRGHFAHRELMNGFGTDYVPGEGAEYGALALIVGEAPGAQEAVLHRPFVGKSGVVLRDLMAYCHLYTEDWQCDTDQLYGVANVWLTNVMKFRPDRNRTPEWIEMTKVRSLLRREWVAVGRPKLIIPIGGSALKAITGREHISIIKHSGWLHRVDSSEGEPLYVWPMLHPSFALRVPAMQKIIEKDWIKLYGWMVDAQNKGLLSR